MDGSPAAAPPGAERRRPHPRTLGWIGTTALAMGGSNQSLFLLAALFVGQDAIPGQGSAAVPLLVAGLLLSWAAAPGWIELVMMFPNRVGGIASSCAEAFRPYSPVLANLTGVCYWWGWVPTCGLTAILSASAFQQWYWPGVPVKILATALVLLFMGVNLCGIRWVARLAVPIASTSALLALVSGLSPVFAGTVDWHQATTFRLTTPFPGWFGGMTSLMAGLYLIGFAAPAFEAAACHVGETRDPNRNVPRAIYASAALAGVYFVLLPVVWLGALGAGPLGQDLALVLGPTFAPVFGSLAKAAAVWFMMFSMFSGTLQPLAGAARTLSQLSEDGLLPRSLALRSRFDVPWVATGLTAAMAILFLWIGDPVWLIAAANFTYLIGIALPSVAAWLLRRDAPEMRRPYRAPRSTLRLGVAAAIVWAVAALLGFEQFGLPTVVFGVLFAYSGSALYAWRKFQDRRRSGLPGFSSTLQIKLTGAMLLVLLLDGTGYLLAVNHIPKGDGPLLTGLSDIFVAVAMLSITVALVLPGMIAHSAQQVSAAARSLVAGTVADFSRAMAALGRGDLGAAHATVAITPVVVHSQDEVGEMARSFNLLQAEIGHAARGLDDAREGLQQARDELTAANGALVQRVQELRQAEEKLSGILESIDNVVWSLSWPDHRLLYVNPAMERIHGRPVADFFDDPTLWLTAIHPDDRRVVQDWLQDLPNKGASSMQYRIMRPSGDIRWIEDRARVVCDDAGLPLRLDGVASDISERKLHDAQMSYLANYDVLTGLPNRNLLNDRIAQSLAQARRSGRPLALLFLDLDGFKFINDSLGHTLGDSLLRSVAGKLTGAVRESDTVARLGGDEFVVMLRDIKDGDDAMALARTLLESLSRPLRADKHTLHVTASIGISIYPEDGDSGELLLQHADLAMYRAKEQGRNGVQRYARDMSARTDERVMLEAALRGALQRDEFELYYQPQVRLADGRVSGVEAVIRWNHPELGLILPNRFVPLAEDTGLIVPIGEWALRTACTQLGAWHAAGYGHLRMAVNLSARQFHGQGIVAMVSQVLREAGVPASHLELELTETALMQNAEAVITMLRDLKALGVGVAMDDFGTGYSSLSYLKRFPVDTIKIDKSFTADLGTSADAAAIARTIIAMAKSLGLQTIAEGVESAEQLEFMIANGCDGVQGFYFSPALPAGQITPCLDGPAALQLASRARPMQRRLAKNG